MEVRHKRTKAPSGIRSLTSEQAFKKSVFCALGLVSLLDEHRRFRACYTEPPWHGNHMPGGVVMRQEQSRLLHDHRLSQPRP